MPEIGVVPHLEQLIYVSSASRLFTENELIRVLEDCRNRNELLDVSGMMVYSDGTFIEVLEGGAEVLSCLFDSVQRDPLHNRCFPLIRQRVPHRSFEGWSMGFRAGSDSHALNLAGFVDFFGDRPIPERGGAAYRILSSFRKQHDREIDCTHA